MSRSKRMCEDIVRVAGPSDDWFVVVRSSSCLIELALLRVDRRWEFPILGKEFCQSFSLGDLIVASCAVGFFVIDCKTGFLT